MPAFETPVMHSHDIADRIRHFNHGRDPERLKLKYQAMTENAFAFLRGTCHLFYEDLPHASLPTGAPAVWTCGDLHLENFGSYKGDNRLVYFDINDFDEAVLAPCTWELLRFLVSVLVAAKTLNIKKPQALTLCRCFLDAYASASRVGKARWVETETAEGMVRDLLKSLGQRKRADFLDRRTQLQRGKRRLRTDGKKALPVSDAQRVKITVFMTKFADQQPNPKFFKLLDVARRVAGTGSLGIERYVLLIEGKGSPDGNYLLDLKQAMPSCLKPYLTLPQPRWKDEAERIVTIQQRVQAISLAFLKPVSIDGVAYVMKGLQPSEDRINLNQWDGKLKRLESVMTTLGEIVAWGQLRSSGQQGSAIADDLMAFATTRQWQPQLVVLALEYSKKIEQDWRHYCGAVSAGLFR